MPISARWLAGSVCVTLSPPQAEQNTQTHLYAGSWSVSPCEKAGSSATQTSRLHVSDSLMPAKRVHRLSVLSRKTRNVLFCDGSETEIHDSRFTIYDSRFTIFCDFAIIRDHELIGLIPLLSVRIRQQGSVGNAKFCAVLCGFEIQKRSSDGRDRETI